MNIIISFISTIHLYNNIREQELEPCKPTESIVFVGLLLASSICSEYSDLDKIFLKKR